MLTFRFSGADGCMTREETLTAGMVGKQVNLELTADWDGLLKTVVFSAGSVTRDVVFTGKVVTIPAEVSEKPMQHLYVGLYKEGYRLNSSGTEKVVDASECANGSIITGFIPVSSGDVVRIYGIPWYRSDPNGNSDGSANYFAAYDANFTFIGAAIGNLSYFYGQWENNPPAYNVTVGDGDLTSELITFTLPSNSNVKYIRMSCCSGKSNLLTDPASAVITVNEEIK